MTDDEDNENEDEMDNSTYKIELSIGDTDLKAEGGDPDRVEENFNNALARAIELSNDLTEDDHHHVQAGAGWLMASASGESPEDAADNWEEMWDKMIRDTKDLSATERQQAGLSDSL